MKGSGQHDSVRLEVAEDRDRYLLSEKVFKSVEVIPI